MAKKKKKKNLKKKLLKKVKSKKIGRISIEVVGAGAGSMRAIKRQLRRSKKKQKPTVFQAFIRFK